MLSKFKIPTVTGDASLNLALDTINKGKQAIIFTNTKTSAEKVAEELSAHIKESNAELSMLSEKALSALAHPTKQCIRLAKCLKKGIAYHHAGLVHKQRELIEENFRKGLIKIICATPTLAYGLDLPAFRVILKDLRRYGAHGLAWIPVLEYLQMCGRAGRPKFDKYGEAIAVAATKEARNEIYKRYICGEPEEIYSKLAVDPVLRTYLLSLIATGIIRDAEQASKFFEKTFWAHQFKDTAHLEFIISKMIKLLKEFGFIMIVNNKYQATYLGRRVAELYIDPLTAHYIITCLKNAGAVKPFPLLQMISHTLEMRPLLKVKMREYDDIQDKLLAHSESLLDKEPSMYDPEYETFLDSVKTALFFNDWIDEKHEEYLLEQYNIRPGEIRVKLETADWLLYATHEFARILEMQNILSEITKLRLRLKDGVKEELLPLLRLKEVGRVRARKLFNAGLKDIADIKKADASTIAQILGSAKIAQDIKEQLGQKVEVVPEQKRKGQLGLGKFDE